jgi:hypothetical protein
MVSAGRDSSQPREAATYATCNHSIYRVTVPTISVPVKNLCFTHLDLYEFKARSPLFFHPISSNFCHSPFDVLLRYEVSPRFVPETETTTPRPNPKKAIIISAGDGCPNLPGRH